MHAGAVEAASANGATAITAARAAASSSGPDILILGVAGRAAGEAMVISLSFLVMNKFGANLLAAQAM